MEITEGGTESSKGIDSLRPEQREFLTQLQHTVDQLNDSELMGKWFMIGGIAREAYTQNADFSVGEPGHPRDIDILVKDGDFIKFERVRAKIQSNLVVGGFLNRYVHAGEQNSFLHYGGVKTNVPAEIFAPKEVDFFGVKLPTLPPETLFHLYCLRGEMRNKDFSSALQIGRYILKHPSQELAEEKYRGFHEFSKKTRHPGAHPQVIMNELSKWYNTTKIARVFPLNGPLLRSVVLHVWDAAGLIGKKEELISRK